MSVSKDDNSRTFTIAEVEYAVRVPTVVEIDEANELRAKTFNEALQRGDLLRDQLEIELRKRELWTNDMEMKYQTLRREILDNEFALQKGGIKLSHARSLAITMANKRQEMVDMLSSRTELDSNTCEGKADAARFNCLFASCLVYKETGKPYFEHKLKSYLEDQNTLVAQKGATEFYYLISGHENVDNVLPENVFLQKFNFVDEKLRLIDSEGRLINQDGKHIDMFGNTIRYKEDGTYDLVDVEGRPVVEEGYAVEHSPFLDEDGSNIDEATFGVDVAEVTETTETKPAAKTKVARKPRKRRVASATKKAPHKS